MAQSTISDYDHTATNPTTSQGSNGEYPQPKFDPNRPMRWYHVLKVLLILGIPYGIAQSMSILDSFGLSFTSLKALYPAFASLFTVDMIVSTGLLVALIYSLFIYSPHAVKLCIILPIYLAFISTLMILSLGTPINWPAYIGTLLYYTVYYLMNYNYLRKRLIPKYWIQKPQTAEQKSPQTSSPAPMEQAPSAVYNSSSTAINRKKIVLTATKKDCAATTSLQDTNRLTQPLQQESAYGVALDYTKKSKFPKKKY